MKILAGMHSVSSTFDDIIAWIQPIWQRCVQLKSIVAKLVLEATAYFIWQERNQRILVF